MTETAGPDLLQAAFTLIEERGWRAFSLVELARRTGLPMDRVYAELPARQAVVEALGRRVDAAMLGLPVVELDGLSPRERVFELVMRRLDALAPFKAGLKVLGREGGLEPELAGMALGNLGRTIGWLLDASGAELGCLRRVGAGPVLALVYGRVFNTWLTDDSADLGPTLAELDKRLRQAETVARWTEWLDGRRQPPEAEAGDAGAMPEPEPA